MKHFKFGKISTRRADTCHIDIQSVLNLAITKTTVDFFIAEGRRGKIKQDEYFAIGASKVKYPDSYHNEKPFSLAVDVVPWVNSKAVWMCDTDEEQAAWNEVTKVMKEAAKELNIPLDWGFDLWKWDRPHWQLTSYRNKS